MHMWPICHIVECKDAIELLRIKFSKSVVYYRMVELALNGLIVLWIFLSGNTDNATVLKYAVVQIFISSCINCAL